MAVHHHPPAQFLHKPEAPSSSHYVSSLAYLDSTLALEPHQIVFRQGAACAFKASAHLLQKSFIISRRVHTLESRSRPQVPKPSLPSPQACHVVGYLTTSLAGLTPHGVLYLPTLSRESWVSSHLSISSRQPSITKVSGITRGRLRICKDSYDSLPSLLYKESVTLYEPLECFDLYQIT
jgi:hypothetical protein